MLKDNRAPPFCQFFGGLGPIPQRHIFLVILFFFHLVRHPSNTGDYLVYCNLYHEEASFYLDVCVQLLNQCFIIIFSLIPQ